MVVLLREYNLQCFIPGYLVLVNDLVHICHCKNIKQITKIGIKLKQKNVSYVSNVHRKVNSLFGRSFNNKDCYTFTFHIRMF